MYKDDLSEYEITFLLIMLKIKDKYNITVKKKLENDQSIENKVHVPAIIFGFVLIIVSLLGFLVNFDFECCLWYIYEVSLS